MMCPDMEVKLNEYIDGTLPAAERVLVAAHLAGCAGCRAAVAELEGLVAGARELPRSIEPPRDLWASIAGRIGKRGGGSGTRWWRERTFWAGALVAAATLVLAFGIYRLTARPADRLAGGEGQEERGGWAAIQADYERSVAELAATLVAERGRLRPETVALVERNLQIIDAAIRESRAVLARDPGNADLRELFAAAYRQKVELLRWATRIATSS